MKRFLSLLVVAASLSAHSDLKDNEREQVAAALDRLITQQRALDQEIASLKKILGLSHNLDGLKPLEPEKSFDKRVRLRTEDGISAFKKGEYKIAKESLQLAWEMDAESAVTNYNLGVAYLKQGNIPLAKKMLKVAIEKRASLDDEGKITAFLVGEDGDRSVPDGKEAQEKQKRITRMTNLSHEADSYLRSTRLDLPRRMNETAKVLDKMVAEGKDYDYLIQKFFFEIADRYVALEMYESAINTFKLYQQGMEGKVLPEDFFVKLRHVEQQKEMLEETLAGYIGNTPNREMRHRVRRDLEELRIFATQLDRFVGKADGHDRDFKKLCDRLGEYRWGGRPNRHVLVVSRHQELLYSSLPGTVPLDRYQDVEGSKFLKNLTMLADRLELKQAEMFEVDLAVGGDRVPYVVMYTYVPRHDAFIIVRMPKADLA